MRRYQAKKHAALAVAATLIITGFSLGNPSAGIEAAPTPPQLTRIKIPLPVDTGQHLPDELATTEQISWQSQHVKRGDNLALIFKRAGFSAGTLHQILQSGKAATQYKHLIVGQSIQLGTDSEHQLRSVKLNLNKAEEIRSVFTDGQWHTEHITQPVEIRPAHASGIIEDSLFLAGAKAGLSDNTIMELAGIFGWDIDFALDIRKGDRFSVIFETKHLDGEQIGTGNILAAEFVNQGKLFQAVRYTDANDLTDYYSPDGRSMRKAFLRTPVKFSRISSKFSRKRWHPVLNKWRSHKGVDYAAPRGTPVKATSDGRIAFRGTKGGYGKVIYIDNGKTYRTVYGHLNNFAKGLRKGSRVKQGQIIGYVGSTGLATGPHLHYELRVNGVHRNPLTVKLPKANPINKAYMADFQSSTASWLQRLALISQSQIAANYSESQQNLTN